MPGWLRCTCPPGGAPGCVCPSLDPPGGLVASEAPQFILFTHDDDITEESYRGLMSVYERGAAQQLACPAVATLFTLARATSE